MASKLISSQTQSNSVTKVKENPSFFKRLPSLMKDPRKRWWVIVPSLIILAAFVGGFYYKLVYLPAHQVAIAPLQTTTAYRGNLTVSAKGTGILQPANQVQLGFGISGRLVTLNVKAGDQVTKGQLLAQLDNTDQQVKYEQAQRNLANLTSPAAIAQAQNDVATAQTTLTNAKYALMHVISPAVFESQQLVLADQQALNDAQTAGGATPKADQQTAIDAAQAKLKKDQALLAGNQIWYKDVYLPLNYTVWAVDPTSTSNSHRRVKLVEGPSDLEIQTSQAAYDVAKAVLQQAQWYLDALNGREVPVNAGGVNLTAYQTAQFAVQTAKANLDGSQIYAPMSGTIISVSAKLNDNVDKTPFIVLGDLTKLYLQTYVSEADYQIFQVGSEADIVFDALPDQTFLGKVIQVNPILDTSTRTSVVGGLVQMDPTTTNLLMGMSASVDVIVGRAQNAVLIPLAALHEYTPGKYAVFVQKNGKLSVDFVQVGLKDQINAEIKSGLQPGDVVSTGLVGTKHQ
jgi:multidrug efflux pump subunit AcrA (membrane-fusion protein)